MHRRRAKQHFPHVKTAWFSYVQTDQFRLMNGKYLFNDTSFSNYLNNLFIAQSEQVKVSEKMSWLREKGEFVCIKKNKQLSSPS